MQAENPYSIRPSDRSCEDRGAELEKVGLVQVLIAQRIAERRDRRETRSQRDQIAERPDCRETRLQSVLGIEECAWEVRNKNASCLVGESLRF